VFAGRFVGGGSAAIPQPFPVNCVINESESGRIWTPLPCGRYMSASSAIRGRSVHPTRIYSFLMLEGWLLTWDGREGKFAGFGLMRGCVRDPPSNQKRCGIESATNFGLLSTFRRNAADSKPVCCSQGLKKLSPFELIAVRSASGEPTAARDADCWPRFS
jgi:hypothetical protein